MLKLEIIVLRFLEARRFFIGKIDKGEYRSPTRLALDLDKKLRVEDVGHENLSHPSEAKMRYCRKKAKDFYDSDVVLSCTSTFLLVLYLLQSYGGVRNNTRPSTLWFHEGRRM
jgi:hypothetical protein